VQRSVINKFRYTRWRFNKRREVSLTQGLKEEALVILAALALKQSGKKISKKRRLKKRLSESCAIYCRVYQLQQATSKK